MELVRLEIDEVIDAVVNSQRELTREEQTRIEYERRAAMMYVCDLYERQADFRWKDRGTKYKG